jgi:hypothetical protein
MGLTGSAGPSSHAGGGGGEGVAEQGRRTASPGGRDAAHPAIKRLLTTPSSDATGYSTKSVSTRGGQLPTLNKPAEYALDTSSDLLAALRFLISALT